MKSHSRTTNSLLNFCSSIGAQLIVMIMNFVVRTVFISTLGKEYLGINGLFLIFYLSYHLQNLELEVQFYLNYMNQFQKMIKNGSFL